ncbi:MAG: lipoate--protein ligase family protein [Calditrichaeota bacterium]|nr:lipoate--protein ligase family protein [Calditrichota bacterium]
METWRLLVQPNRPGDWHMAADSVIAAAIGQGKVPSTVRLYTWLPDTISLGYHQSEEEINLEACRRDGVAVVRRPTGGRAIYHRDEITYAALFPSTSRLYDSRLLTCYANVSRVLKTALERFSIRLDPFEAVSSSAAYAGSPVCFARALSYELTIGGRKMVGSAQRRWPDRVLQHGSILLGESHQKLADYLNLPAEKRAEEKRNLLEGTICVRDVSPRSISLTEFAEALQESFLRLFEIKLVPGTLTSEELSEIEAIRGEFRIV